MKLILLFLPLALFSLTAFSQEFDGVKIGGTKSQFIKAMSEKGYSVKEETPTVMTFKSSAHPTYEVYGAVTPTTHMVWKLTIFLPAQSNWYDLKADYNKYLKLLTEKYGEPTNKYAFFASPYDEGDGYEMSAVSLDKCDFLAIWEDIAISVRIYKSKQVELSYENTVNGTLNEQEKNEADKKIF